MSNEEFGMYMRLLCYQWSYGAIPSEAKRLQNLLASRRPIPAIVLEKFKLCEDGKYRNDRMELEREKQSIFRLKQALNGSNGGRPIKPKNNPSLLSGETQTISQKKPFSLPLQSSKEREIEFAWENSVDEAISICTGIGIPEDFIRRVWLQHDGTTWLDSQGRKISNFRSYLSGRYSTEMSYRNEKSSRIPITRTEFKPLPGRAQYEPKKEMI